MGMLCSCWLELIVYIEKHKSWDLVNATHAKGTPWHEVVWDGSTHKEINKTLIKELLPGIA